MTAVCCDIQTQWYTGNCDAMKATLTPKPTPTPKPRNFTLDSGITASGGYVTVKWTDSANRSPYMVYTQKKVRNELADWYYEWTTDAKSMRLENLAPGREYEITVEDCDGNWISRTYTIPSAASFSDGQLKTNSIRTTIEYRQEPAGSGGSGMKSVDSISASAILRDMGKTDYGIYYWIRYPQPAYSREYFTQAFFVDPYAQANCVNYFIWTYGKQYSGLTG